MKKIDTKLMHPAEQIALIIGRIYRRKMTTTSGGNLSIMDDNGDMWITPAGIDKGSLTPADIMCVKADGTIVGPHRPSSEYPFHRALYKMRPKLRSVIHAHPPGLVTFSIVHQVPDTSIIPQARGVCGPVGFAPYALPGSELLGEKIAAEFAKNPDYKAVIMENHGVVLMGDDIADAYQRLETLELCARTILNARTLGKPVYLSEEQILRHEKAIHVDFQHFMNVEHPSDERAIRTNICEIVHRACAQGLMCSSYGTASVRWRGDDFLITPSDKQRWDLEPEDIVQVRDGMVEAGKNASRSVALHYDGHEVRRPDHPGELDLPAGCAAVSFRESVPRCPDHGGRLQETALRPAGERFRDCDRRQVDQYLRQTGSRRLQRPLPHHGGPGRETESHHRRRDRGLTRRLPRRRVRPGR